MTPNLAAESSGPALDLLVILSGLLAEVLGTTSGLGSSLFFVPIAIQFKEAHFVLAFTAIFHCFGNLSKLRLFHQKLKWRKLALIGGLSVLGSGLGASLNIAIPMKIFNAFLGLSLIALPLTQVWMTHRNRSLPRFLVLVLAFLSGFSTGLVGTGGALRGFVLNALGFSKLPLVFASAAIDLGGDLVRAGIYLQAGYMDWSQWYYIPALGVAAYFGTRIGKNILLRVPQKVFEYLIFGSCIFSGAVILATNSW